MSSLKTYRFCWKDGTQTVVAAINTLYAVKFAAYKKKIDLFDVIHLFKTMEKVEGEG